MKILITADWHVRGERPLCRTDEDWIESQRKTISEIRGSMTFIWSYPTNNTCFRAVIKHDITCIWVFEEIILFHIYNLLLSIYIISSISLLEAWPQFKRQLSLA